MKKAKSYKGLYKIVILVIGMILIMQSVFTLNIKGASAREANSMVIYATKNSIVVEGNLSSLSGDVYLVRFKTNQYHSSTPFLQVEDAKNTSLKYYDKNCEGVIESKVTANDFTIVIDRYTEDGQDKAYEKYYIISGGTVTDNLLGGGTVLIGPKYATEFYSQRNYERIEQASIKGLEVMIVDDGEDLGINHTNHVLDMNSILSNSNDSNALTFRCNGKIYYFDREAVEENDKILKAFTEAGMETTMVLNMWAYAGVVDKTDLLHPEFDFDPALDPVLGMAAPNMVQDKGIYLYEAVCEFLADRYTREDALYGRVSNWIVGNEVDTSAVWHNMGQVPQSEFVRQYDRSLRILYAAVKKYWAHGNVMAVFTQSWTLPFTDLFVAGSAVHNKWHNYGCYGVKYVLEEFSALTKLEGDYDWKIALHPYGRDMRDDNFWDQSNYEISAGGLNALYLTPLNIEVLPQFLAQSHMRYKGKMRDFYFTEQGYSSKPTLPEDADGDGDQWDEYNWETDYDPETSFTEESFNKQSAMYAYAYYKFKFIGAKAMIFHRHFDYFTEQSALGILMREKGTREDIYGKKPVWEVMKYIDTEKSLEYTQPLLQYINVWTPTGTFTPTSWEQLIPGDPMIEGYERFDANKLADAPLVKSATLTEKDALVSNVMTCDFEDGDTNGWHMVDNAVSFNILKMEDTALSGQYFGQLSYTNDKSVGGGMSYKGIEKKFETPVNLSDIDCFNFAIHVTATTSNSDVTQNVKVRFYSGEKVYESVAQVESGRYYRFSAKLKDSGWDGLDAVDKVKIWFNRDTNDIQASAIYFDEIGFYKEGQGSINGGASADGESGGQTTPDNSSCYGGIEGAWSCSVLCCVLLIVIKKLRKKAVK